MNDEVTNWYGSIEEDWENHETGERIEFRYEEDGIEVWIVNDDEKRGQRWVTTGSEIGARFSAMKAAEKYNENAKFPIND